MDALLARGNSVRVFDRPGTASAFLTSHSGLEVVEGDFSSEGDVAEAVRGCDVCFHMVSTTLPKSSNADPIYDVESNLIGSIRFAQCAVAAGVRKIIFTSSGGTVYGVPRFIPIDEDHPTNPICSYGITKLAIEKYLELFRQLHGLDYCVVRISNPYGERQRVTGSQGAVAVFLGKILRGESVEIWGDGSVTRDYIHVSDVVSAMVRCIGYSGDRRVLNISSGCGLSLDNILHGIERVTGLTAKPIYLPGRQFDVPFNVLSNAHARRELAWEPEVGFIEGVGRMATWAAQE